MGAGQFRDRVTFERLDATEDRLGNETSGTWASFLEVWADYRPGRGDEAREGGGLVAQVSGTLIIRHSSAALAITTADRVLIDGVAHQIREIVDPNRRRKTLKLTIESGHAT